MNYLVAWQEMEEGRSWDFAKSDARYSRVAEIRLLSANPVLQG